tara:strand:+ start:1647 stop:1844 length:198 start_codon:yes stop_codon:yes gene_type:complete
MLIEPEIIPSSSEDGRKAKRMIPSWVVLVSIVLGIFILAAMIKAILPIIILALILGFICTKILKS